MCNQETVDFATFCLPIGSVLYQNQTGLARGDDKKRKVKYRFDRFLTVISLKHSIFISVQCIGFVPLVLLFLLQKVLPAFINHNHCHGIQFTILEQSLPDLLTLIVRHFFKLRAYAVSAAPPSRSSSSSLKISISLPEIS